MVRQSYQEEREKGQDAEEGNRAAWLKKKKKQKEEDDGLKFSG